MHRRLRLWGLTLGLILTVSKSQAFDQILEIKEKLYPRPEKTQIEGKTYQFNSAVSQKNLLGLERKSLFSLPEPSSISAQPVTIKILAVRVSFQPEIPDDPTTTGNGVFDMRPFEDFSIEEGHEIDPSPHDDAYFRSHLEALNNYWSTVSKGKINLQYDVYPLTSYIFYELPHSMAYYGQQRPDSGLGELFKDTWQLVDQQNPEIDFSQYQAFVIFHAGSDQQSNLSFSPTNTPNDLFTGFILMGDPVPVDGGAVLIGEGLIMPETVCQDTRIAALNAVIAHEFGHQLGLVDLYKTYDAIRQEPAFTTQVGDFSLMDNNGTSVAVDLGFRSPVFGTLPVYPDAWSRAYLGFDLPVEIQSQQDALVRAAGMLTDSLQIVKIPINSQEYFLLENRFIDLDKDGRTDLKGDPVTGVILGPGKLVGATAVLTREYDALLPGSGILIWHVDEGVAYLDYIYGDDRPNNFLSNTLQGDKERRFVSLEEADGIIDFGGDYYTGFGGQEDMYYRENNSAFTPTTYPSSRSNTGADTHIRVTGIGPRDTVMQCDIAVDLYQVGWPQRFKPAPNTSSLVAYDVNGDTIPELFLTSGNKIYAWKKDGSKLISNLDTDSFTIYDQESTSVYPAAVFAVADAPIVGAPAIADMDGSGPLGPLLVAATETGLIYIWLTQDLNLDGYADLFPGYPLPSICAEIVHQPVIGDFLAPSTNLEALVPCEDGRLYFVGPNCCPIQPPLSAYPSRGVALSKDTGLYYILRETNLTYLSRETATTSQWTKLISATGFFAPVAGDIDRDGAEDVVAVNRDGLVIAHDSAGNLMDGYPINLGEKVYSKPVLGDIDGDGYLEMLFGGDNKIWALNYNGTVASNFPIIIGKASSVGPITSSPILVDLNSDFRTEVIVGSPGREILVYSGLGERPTGFPLSTADRVLTSGLVANFDRTGGTDSERELAFACSDGFVYVWNINGTYDSLVDYWVMENYDAGHSNLFPSGKLPTPPVAGPNLVEPRRFYSYPNPASGQAIVRYYLNYDSQIELKFFDLAGNLVDTHQAMGQAFTDNEFVWNCSGMASGVYLCRIEATGQGKSQTEFCKIAIVK